MSVFGSADILIPRVEEMEKWAVIACDQFTSQPEYWQQAAALVGAAPSALGLILPEYRLGGEYESAIPAIHETMETYLAQGRFQPYGDSFVYVERTLQNGQIRRGLVGAVDLEAYDYGDRADTPVRATERTVVERIPPRMKVRQGAALELPHVLLLCDDEQAAVVEPLTAKKGALPLLYDFDLMEGGGHIAGWLVAGAEAERVRETIAAYEQRIRARSAVSRPMLYAVGDGNHSLATAKACWEAQKRQHPGEDLGRHPARYALVELENLRDPCQQIDPIHRIVTHTDPAALLAKARAEIGAEEGYAVPWRSGKERGTLCLNPALGALPVGILQSFLDRYLAEQPGEIDYIHDDAALEDLAAAEGAVGFLLPPIEKEQLFGGIDADGVLPRKTFSMGHAREKRYYLEARKIR